MPSSGKTTHGEWLGNHYGIPFKDLDQEIASSQEMSVRDIFDQKGEETFRFLERCCLKRLAGLKSSLVISCGGGTPCFGPNAARMYSCGLMVYLRVPPCELTIRMDGTAPWRPVMGGAGQGKPVVGQKLKDSVGNLLEIREAYYRQAHLSLDAASLDSKRIGDQLDKHPVSKKFLESLEVPLSCEDVAKGVLEWALLHLRDPDLTKVVSLLEDILDREVSGVTLRGTRLEIDGIFVYPVPRVASWLGKLPAGKGG